MHPPVQVVHQYNIADPACFIRDCFVIGGDASGHFGYLPTEFDVRDRILEIPVSDPIHFRVAVRSAVLAKPLDQASFCCKPTLLEFGSAACSGVSSDSGRVSSGTQGRMAS
jgi:hypothetical protein